MTLSWTTIFLIILAPLFCISVMYNIRFARSLLRLQDNIEASLDVLDNRYNAIAQILEKPVFFDSMEIRQVVTEISKSRDAILYVANILGQVEDTNTLLSNKVEDV